MFRDLGLPVNLPRRASSLSVHHIETKVLRKKRGNLALTETPKRVRFAIATKEQSPDVVLPEVRHQNPMVIWMSKTELAGTSLAEEIGKQWKRPCIKNGEIADQSGISTSNLNMAEFSVFVESESVGKGFQSLAITKDKDTARKTEKIMMTKDTEQSSQSDNQLLSILNIWSHNQRINGLHSHIMGQNGGKKRLDDLMNFHDSMLEDDEEGSINGNIVTKFISHYHLDDLEQLPNSFKYPTMQIKLNILPLVNQVGVNVNKKNQEGVDAKDRDGVDAKDQVGGNADDSNNLSKETTGCLVMENDNKAHLKALKKGGKTVEFDSSEHIRALVEHHRDYLKETASKKPSTDKHASKRPQSSNSKPSTSKPKRKRC